MQFFRFLYHNVPDLSPLWHSAEFLFSLAASVFPFNIRPYSEMVRTPSCLCVCVCACVCVCVCLCV